MAKNNNGRISTLENKTHENYKNFLFSKRFEQVLYMAVSGDDFINTDKIVPLVLRLTSRQNISQQEYKLLERVFRDSDLKHSIFSKLNDEDFSKISGESLNKPEDRNNIGEEGSKKYENYKIFEKFIAFILEELKYKQLEQIVDGIKSGVKGVLETNIVFSGKNYDLIRIGKEYYVYNKRKKEIYRNVFHLAEKYNIDGKTIGYGEFTGDLFITADGKDYVVEFYDEYDNPILVLLSNGRIIKPKSLQYSERIIIKDGNTIAIFDGEDGRTQICIETGKIIKGNIFVKEPTILPKSKRKKKLLKEEKRRKDNFKKKK